MKQVKFNYIINMKSINTVLCPLFPKSFCSKFYTNSTSQFSITTVLMGNKLKILWTTQCIARYTSRPILSLGITIMPPWHS